MRISLVRTSDRGVRGFCIYLQFRSKLLTHRFCPVSLLLQPIHLASAADTLGIGTLEQLQRDFMILVYGEDALSNMSRSAES